MKTKFSRRILAFVLAFALVVPMFVFNVGAATKDLTLDFSNESNKVSLDSNKQVWSQNGITLTNTKTSSSNAIAAASGHIRIYKGSDVTIECKGMTKIVLTCTGSKYATAPTGLKDATATNTSTTIVTITLNSAMDSFTFNCNGSQLRVTKMVVTTQIDDAAPTISLSGDNFVAINGTTTITPTATNLTENIVWESSNSDVATVNGGVVTGVAAGEVTITASANGVSASTNVKVFPVQGELTIAEALKVCEVAGTTNSPFAYWTTGVITECTYSEEHSDYTVTITDGTDSIVAYGITGDAEIMVGDEITVTGYLINYNNTTKEFATGSTYKKIVNDVTEAIRAELNEIAAQMSLAFQYEANVESVELPSTQTCTDLLNRTFTGATSTTYIDWEGKSVSNGSGAIYAGNNAGSNDSIQLRSNNSNSGIVTTASGGKAVKIIVAWNSNTGSDRTLDIYGKNTAYSSPTDLYSSDSNTKGTKIGSIKNGTTELVLTGDYEYIGIRSNSGAMYLTSIEIVWESEVEGGGDTVQQEVFSNSQFAIRCGVDAALTQIEGIDEYGIKVTAGGKSKNYTTDANSWTVANGMAYITLELGDIINDLDKLGTEFTVEAYVIVDGFEYTSSQSATYSVADMVNTYNTQNIAEVAHLYNYLVSKGLI